MQIIIIMINIIIHLSLVIYLKSLSVDFVCDFKVDDFGCHFLYFL